VISAGGFCKVPDFAWGDWAVGQVERVWDLMDITVLRAAKIGVDPSYKTYVIYVSLSSYLPELHSLQPSMEPLAERRPYYRLQQGGHMSLSHTIDDPVHHEPWWAYGGPRSLVHAGASYR
jgi:hypothetical protein